MTNFSHEICRKRLTFFLVDCSTPDNVESLYLNSNAIRNLCTKIIHTEQMYSYLENVFIFYFNRSTKKSKQHFVTFYKSCCCWLLFEKFLDFFCVSSKNVKICWIHLSRACSLLLESNAKKPYWHAKSAQIVVLQKRWLHITWNIQFLFAGVCILILDIHQKTWNIFTFHRMTKKKKSAEWNERGDKGK